MEALAAVSLAGNVLQFVDTVKTLISFSRQISSSGATEEHIELSVIAQELQGLASRVTPPKPADDTKLTPEDESVRTLAAQCNQVAEELLSVLKVLRVKNSVVAVHGAQARFESVNKALLSVWKQPQIEELQRRLDRIRANIEIYLATSNWDKLFKRLNDLGCENERLEARREDDIRTLKDEFKDLLDGMKDNLSQSDTRSHAMTALLAAAKTGSRYSAEQIILEHLRFDTMSLRYDTIHIAHRETLIWIFDKGEQRSPGTFDKWLLSDENLYWISGKPGSGKSTLMKFLCDHPRTLERLRVWAMNDRLVSAQYFLWNAGKDGLQKSQEGLLRSLVYQILRQCPDMIPLAYPNAWRVYFAEDEVPIGAPTAGSKYLDFGINLTVPGLLTTLQDICTAAVASDTRLYFFIDGLDEYNGKPADMISLIRTLRKLPALKLCLSSRPWNEFEQEFGKNQTRKLYMQDFNGPDIKAFVYDTIQEDENYKESEKSSVDLLAQEIVEAANGVFLWVFLVVRSFQEGLLNGDRISYLRKRLRELPSDLNDYFEKILFHDVKKFYRAGCAEMFSVTVAGAADLPFMVYWFMGDEDPDYALKLKVEPLTKKEIDDRLKSTKKRVNASCKGLLEVQFMPTSSTYEDDPRSSGDGEISESIDYEDGGLPSSIFNWKVNYLHRTVYDFLVLNETKNLLNRWHSPGFDAHETICKALLAQIKTAPKDSEKIFWSVGQPLSQLCNLYIHHYQLLAPQHRQSVCMNLHILELRRVLDVRGAVFYREGIPVLDETSLKDSTVQDKSKTDRGRSISKLLGKLRGKKQTL